MAQKNVTKHPLTLHELLGALSYWGTAVRLMIVAILMVAVYLMNITFDTTAAYVDGETIALIYALGTFFLFDFCYVLIARAQPIHHKTADRSSILLLDFMLMLFYLVPSLVVTSVSFEVFRYGVLVVALLALAIRILLGFLYSTKK